MASRPTALLSTLLLCLYGLPSIWCDCDNATQMSIQVDSLLAEYDREIPPTSKVFVTVTLDVRHAAVDEHQAVMRMFADLKMRWQEPRTRWNATEWGCDNALTVPGRLWVPDLEVLNAAATSDGSDELRVRMDASGFISWIIRLDVAVPVALALEAWPTDIQTCTFKFGSRVYNSDELELTISEFKHAVVFESAAWEILKVSGTSSTWQRGEENVSTATWSVRVARRGPAHDLAATAVLLAAALLLVTAAGLPPHQRYPLAACASFTAALWLSTALLRVPGGVGVPRVLALMCALCVCGAASGACAALVQRVSRCCSPPPQALRAALSSLSIVCKLTPSPESCMTSESGAWAAAGVLADRVFTAAILITLLILLAVQLF